MPLKLHQSEELPSVNLTPMIDVVFLLIIFFMVGTQFSTQERQIEIKLPGVGSFQTLLAPPPRREVLIDSTGQAFLDGRPVTPLELQSRLTDMRMQYPDLAVAVRADAQARQKDVVPVYGAINKAGVTNMAVVGLENEKLR